jgi:hypothetical protein
MRTFLLTTLFGLLACGGDIAPQAPPPPPDSTSGRPVGEGPPPAEPAPTPVPFMALDGEGRRVFFVEPADGATVKSPFRVVFGIEGLEVKPAGDNTPNSGHHHIILDGAPEPIGTVVPADATHIHFGGGQTETTVELPPGEHTLTMQLADFLHRSYGPGLAATIKVTVSE